MYMLTPMQPVDDSGDYWWYLCLDNKPVLKLLYRMEISIYSKLSEVCTCSICHERTPSGPGKSVRSLQVAADQR